MVIRNYLIAALCLALPVFVMAQSPVKWTYSAKKTGEKAYEVHITASIEKGWHLYAQIQPEDAIALPTEIKFNSNPLLTFTGNIKEVGKLEKTKELTLGTEAWQYGDKVDFVQTIKLKANVKTNIGGSIEFQACTDEKCLPPKTVKFSLGI